MAMMKYLNFPTNIGEIIKPLPRQVEELAVLLIRAIGLLLSTDELQHKRPAGANIITPRQEVATHKCFKDARLAATLAANDGDLRKVNGGLASNQGEDILKPVD